MNLLPYPRHLKRQPGIYNLPARSVLHLDGRLERQTVLLPLAKRLQSAADRAGVQLETVLGPAAHPRLAIGARQSTVAPDHPEGYAMVIDSKGVRLHYRHEGGLRAGVATMLQLLRQYGRRLPRLAIRDYPDFGRRGVMLDVSRGRVPNLSTLLALVEHLADFKINELQLYTEHTFAYRQYESIWGAWGALTGQDILELDARCRTLGIDLVPNQNSFGHLRYWLEHPRLKKLGEVSRPYEGQGGTFLRYPSTLAPNHPQTLPFLRGLYDELLPHFTSRWFNVGCDETWDLGRGQSKALCQAHGKGRVYAAFLKRIYDEIAARGRQMMFWGDIVLHYPELIAELPKDIIALDWGYDAGHPWEKEAGQFAGSKVPFYVCPGTSTWMSLIGRHDNCFANLREAAAAGRKHGALGLLNTDWGDGGHPQPLAVSYLPFLAGAAFSWCSQTFDETMLVPVLSRDVFRDPTQRAARAALELGLAHRAFEYTAPNVTPFGAVIAAPRPASRELFCRDGLKYYARIPARKIRAALDRVEHQRAALGRAQPDQTSGASLILELNLAARMAAQSCKIMLWQQAVAAGKQGLARTLATTGIRQLSELDADFRDFWPSRNKGTTEKCSAFLKWRIEDYRGGRLHFSPETARQASNAGA